MAVRGVAGDEHDEVISVDGLHRPTEFEMDPHAAAVAGSDPEELPEGLVEDGRHRRHHDVHVIRMDEIEHRGTQDVGVPVDLEDCKLNLRSIIKSLLEDKNKFKNSTKETT